MVDLTEQAWFLYVFLRIKELRCFDKLSRDRITSLWYKTCIYLNSTFLYMMCRNPNSFWVLMWYKSLVFEFFEPIKLGEKKFNFCFRTSLFTNPHWTTRPVNEVWRFAKQITLYAHSHCDTLNLYSDITNNIFAAIVQLTWISAVEIQRVN